MLVTGRRCSYSDPKLAFLICVCPAGLSFWPAGHVLRLTLGVVTEGLAAHLALEGLVASVDVLVLQHVGLTQETLATEGTRKVLEVFPR